MTEMEPLPKQGFVSCPSADLHVLFKNTALDIDSVRVHSQSPQDVLPLYADYSEPSATLAKGSAETSASPLTTWKNLN